MQNKNKQVNILILTLLVAVVVVICPKAYLRPWQPGGPFYEPERVETGATSEAKAEIGSIGAKEAETAPQGQETGKKAVIKEPAWYEITAYCLNQNPMASGLMPYPGAIACPGFIHLGTKVEILSDKFIRREFVCEDRMGLKYRHGNYIDIWMPDCEIALNFGRQKLLINIDN